MKSKTISYILGKKFDHWLKSIKDEGVRGLVKNNTIITGGCITTMLLNEPLNDYDFYFRNVETVEALAKYYVDEFLKINGNPKFKGRGSVALSVINEGGRVKIFAKSAGVASETGNNEYQYFESVPENIGSQTDFIDSVVISSTEVSETELITLDPSDEQVDESIMTAFKNTVKGGGEKYRPIFLTTNAITLADQVQIIIRFYGEPDEIHKNYDFIHCTNYWDSKTRQLTLHKDALEAILSKTLVYRGSLYPICSLFRIRKFIKRGWSITAGQILKMAMQISELDLSNIAVLRDQLVGVDVAYFFELLEVLREGEKGRKIDSTYIAELVDKIF